MHHHLDGALGRSGPRTGAGRDLNRRPAALAAVLGAGAALAACTDPGATRLARDLAARDSATATLQARCPLPVSAERVRGTDAPAPAALAETLRLATGAPLGYRHVRLLCGAQVLSEAHNWYVPARLTPAMNHLLGTSDVPFGRVAAPLGFSRERLASRHGRDRTCPRGTVLSQTGLLRLPGGAPLALVVECYTAAAAQAR